MARMPASHMRLGVCLFFYRILVTCLALAVLIRALARGQLTEVRQRLGLGTGSRTAHLWLHGASNGELASARPIINALLAAQPDLHLLITSNSASGQSLAANIEPERITSVLAPLDLAWATRRFVRRWSVTGHVTLESEFWPNRLCALSAAGKPCLALGARLSERSARGWGRLPGVTRNALGTLSFLSPQDQASGQRFIDLGLKREALGEVFDLKALYTPKHLVPDEKPLPSTYKRCNSWLAASTHEGEEQLVLEAHAIARRTEPDLKLILAPRHPARADALSRLIANHGFSSTRRSQPTAPPTHPATQPQVFLADTLGEMDLWYAQAGRVFIGGSLVEKGGHTPYEPATHRCALIHGPHVDNFVAAYKKLACAQAALAVESSRDLAEALARLSPQDAQSAAGTAARTALHPVQTADWLVTTLLEHLKTTQ